MSWRWIAGVRGAGVLGPLAAAFAQRELGEERAPGPNALIALASSIDRFAKRSSPSPTDEAAFVEGAGAFLALVLIAYLGGAHATRDGSHRVRLGEAGFFDPFAAITTALDTDPARAALVDAVDLAERESRGTGPIARTAIAFARVLAERRVELAITDRFDRRVWMGDVEVDLTRAISATEDESDATLASAVGKLVDMLPGGVGADIDADDALARVVPRLIGPTFDLAVATAVIAIDLRIAWVLAYEGRARFVTGRDLERWSITSRALAARAVDNLAARSGRARFTRIDLDEGPCIVARSGDGLDSARLLLPALAETLAPEIGSPCIVAVPHRDALYACADDDAAVRVLSRRVTDDHARAPHGITARLYRLHASGAIEALVQ